MLVTGVLIRSISRARAVAFEVLQSVASGAYASDALLEKSRLLSQRDAGLAAQIVFGCLRYQLQLDFLILHYGGRGAPSLDPPVLTALRTAIFQIRYLERVPAHAAVHESVEYVKAQKRPAAGFVNAVLRKVNRDPVRWPDTATELSCPEWLLQGWERHFGAAHARLIAQAALNEPVPYVRVAPGSNPWPGAQLEKTPVAGCFRPLSPAPEGIRLQDISSQAIVPMLELRPDHSYLDLCAAPGNKTIQALESGPRLAVACDISFRRVSSIPAICPRVVLDAATPLPFSCRFDRIFIDAPCSGTGTLARNPEIKWRVQRLDFERFQQLQSRIVYQAIQWLAPGGKLLYATCSLEEQENEQVIAGIISSIPGLRCTAHVWRLPGRDEGDGFYAAVLE